MQDVIFFCHQDMYEVQDHDILVFREKEGKLLILGKEGVIIT